MPPQRDNSKTASGSRARRMITCPFCGNQSAQITDRQKSDEDEEWLGPLLTKPTPINPNIEPATNYYLCTTCGGKFSTREVYVLPHRRWLVRRRSQSIIPQVPDEYEHFNFQKIYGSLTKATRKVDPKTLWTVTRDVDRFLGKQAEILPAMTHNSYPVFDAKQIGEAVMLSLLAHNLVCGWTRYALVFYEKEHERDFTALQAFLSATYLDHVSRLMKVLSVNTRVRENETWADVKARKFNQRKEPSAKEKPDVGASLFLPKPAAKE